MSFLDKARPVATPNAPVGTPTPAPVAPKTNVSFASKVRPVAAAPVVAETKNDVRGGFVGDVLTGNTQRFGKTVGESIAAPANAQNYADVLERHTNTQNELIRRIREKKSKNEDTSRLENALDILTKEAPKLEEFTGDVINKTTGQVAGEAAGTALEILPFGTYGKAAKGAKSFQMAGKVEKALPTAVEAGKNLLTKPGRFLTKEGAKQAAESAAFGYGVDVSQGLQGGRGEDRTGGKAFIPGAGTAVGVAAPGVLKTAGKVVSKGVEKVQTTLADRAAKAAGEADHLIGTIIQGQAKDIPAARRAFSQIDTTGIKTQKDLGDALDAKIKVGSEKLREALGYEPYVKPLDELTLTSKVGDIEVSHNFVDDALNQLDEYYAKTGNYEDAAKIKALKNKAATEGITLEEINDLAIRHGQDLSGFNPATGELASGLKKQMAENTRKGLKETARKQFNNKVYNETDAALSDLIKTRDLVRENEEAVLKLKQRTRDATLPERAGALLEQVLNFASFGTSRGFLQSGRDLGLFKAKTNMDAVEIEKLMNKNLKRLKEIINSPSNQMESKLEDFLLENKVMPVRPPRIQKKFLEPKPKKVVKKKP